MKVADPVLFIGVDIGVRRDTSAMAAVYRAEGGFMLWGHKIITPRKKGEVFSTGPREVNIHKNISDTLLKLCEDRRVAGIWYDPFQFISESQRLTDKGFGRLLFEVNQQTEMPGFSNTLETCITEGSLFLYPDQEVKNHFLWTTAKETERGWRIIKRKQTKPIDFVVALGMALYGASSADGELYHPSYREDVHSMSMMSLP